MKSIERLQKVMAALRHPQDGCPWDLEQTFASVAPYTIEEAYEVADAIARGDLDELRGELGDLLFQVVFHARMAEEQGAFDLSDVADAIVDKLTRRHPHVFGSPAERAAGQSSDSWESIKAAERAGKQDDGALAGVATALPALHRAQKLGGRAARVGFDWPEADGVRRKVTEELDELDVARAQGEQAAVEEEFGDLLFALANFGRHLGLDAETALQKANAKFIERFEGMERDAEGQPLADLSLDALEALWEAQKGR